MSREEDSRSGHHSGDIRQVDRRRSGPIVQSLAQRAVLLGIMWWAMSGGDPDAIWFGLIGVTIALAVSFWLSPVRPPALSISGCLAFLPFFVTRSVRGGLQVARMAVRSRPDLHPAVHQIRLGLRHEWARLFLASVLSLLPGALAAGLDGDILSLHMIDHRMPIEEEVREAELLVARMFGESLP